MTVGSEPPTKGDALHTATAFITSHLAPSGSSGGSSSAVDLKRAQAVNFVLLSAGLVVASVLKGFTFEYVFRLPGFSFTQTFAAIDLLLYSAFALLQNRVHAARDSSVQPVGRTRFLRTNLILGALLVANHGAGTAAIMFVNFPTKVVLKSCKLLPAMLIGRLMLGKRYSVGETVSVLLLIVGLIGFTTSDMSLEGPRLEFGIGFILLTASVFGDAMHATTAESTMKQDASSREDILVWSHLFCGAMLVLVSIAVGELAPCVRYFMAHPISFLATLVNALLGYVSIVFYMHLVQRFSAISAIMVAQTRKFFTVFISFILFPKPVSVTYIFFALWVLSAIAMNVVIKHRERHAHPSPLPQTTAGEGAGELRLDMEGKMSAALATAGGNGTATVQPV